MLKSPNGNLTHGSSHPLNFFLFLYSSPSLSSPRSLSLLPPSLPHGLTRSTLPTCCLAPCAGRRSSEVAETPGDPNASFRPRRGAWGRLRLTGGGKAFSGHFLHEHGSFYDQHELLFTMVSSFSSKNKWIAGTHLHVNKYFASESEPNDTLF